MPRIAFIGVRISWLMLARNSLLARVADCASTSAASSWRRWPSTESTAVSSRRRMRSIACRIWSNSSLPCGATGVRVSPAPMRSSAAPISATLATMGFISPRRTITKVANASTSQPTSMAVRTLSTKAAAWASRAAFSRRAAATVNSTRSRWSANSGCSVCASSSRAVAMSLRCSAGSRSRSTTWK